MKYDRFAANVPLHMDYGHEPTDYERNGPFHIFMHGANEIPLHWHETLEVIVVLRGTLRMTVGKSLCNLQERDVMIINPFTVHGSTAWDPETLVCGVHLSADHFDTKGLTGFARRHYLCRSFLHGRSFEQIAGPIRSAVARLLLSSGQDKSESYANELLAGILALFIYRYVPWQETRADDTSLRSAGGDRIVQIMREVRACGARDFSLAGFGAREGVTVSYLSRMFKGFVGIGYRDYVQNVRLDNAAAMLREDRMPISDIMDGTGFTNPTHFFRKFKARYGCSPGQYRRKSHAETATHHKTSETRRAELELLTGQLEGGSEALHSLIFGISSEPSLAVGVSIHQPPRP